MNVPVLPVILFTVLVAVFAFTLLGTFIVAHAQIRRRTAAWWLGALLAIGTLAHASGSFKELPRIEGSQQRESLVDGLRGIDYARITRDATQVSLWKVLFAFIGSILVFEAMARIRLHDIIVAFVICILTFCSVFFLGYVFAIREDTPVVFSLVLGLLLGLLFHLAFSPGSEKMWGAINKGKEQEP